MAELPQIPKLDQLENAGPGVKKYAKPVLIGVLVLLLGAFGLEASNNDFDLGSLLSGNSVQESKVARDSDGNVMYDREGNIVTDATLGKGADEYNCEDFMTQPQAQTFFTKIGGTNRDLNRLDGDKDGEACESLPKGAQE